jgi:hypothetical protein
VYHIIVRMTETSTINRVVVLNDVEGWFGITDQLVMDRLLGFQARVREAGDLLELGAYLGKSAILIGDHVKPGERLVVCDLFGAPAPDGDNREESEVYYSSLTRERFEANFRAFHDWLPDIVHGPTSSVPEYVPAGSCRFIHVDASHLYEHVRQDVEMTQRLLRPNGIVVFDDFRAAHTPGVAAAVWPDIVNGCLRPIAITPNKLYATWGDPERAQLDLLSWLHSDPNSRSETQQVAGCTIVRISDWRSKPLSPVDTARAAAVPPAVPQQAVAPSPAVSTKPKMTKKDVPAPRSAVRRAAVDLLPPLMLRAIRRAGRRR